MRFLPRALCLSFVVFAAPLLAAEGKPAETKPAPVLTAQKFEAQVPATFDYLEYLPADYDQQDKWPLMIFLHGAGERGNDLELIKKHGPPKLVAAGKHFPFVLISPQCQSNKWWHMQLGELDAFVEAMVKKYKVDPDRVYLTGISMGGFGTWALGAYKPERFAALAPVCGGGEVLATRALVKMPIWVFHGAKDPVVPLKRSEDLVDALKRQRSDVKFTVYPDLLHDSWTVTYDNPQVYEWMLAQKRGGKIGT